MHVSRVSTPMPEPHRDADEPSWVGMAREIKLQYVERTDDGMVPWVAFGGGGPILEDDGYPVLAYRNAVDPVKVSVRAAFHIRFALAARSICLLYEGCTRSINSAEPLDAKAVYEAYEPGETIRRYHAGDPTVTRSIMIFHVAAGGELTLFALPYFYSGKGTRFFWYHSQVMESKDIEGGVAEGMQIIGRSRTIFDEMALNTDCTNATVIHSAASTPTIRQAAMLAAEVKFREDGIKFKKYRRRVTM